MSALRIQLYHGAPVPLYYQLAEQITTAITAGEIGDGECLEGSQKLAERLRISSETVLHAYRKVADAGYVERVASSCYVARRQTRV